MSAAPARNADAVRYVVLQRLASGFRHALMGELQSIQFLAELGARLSQTGVDDSRMRESVGKIPAATGKAVAACHSMIEWLRPDEAASATLGDAVGQCVRLAGDDWRMRGIEANVEVPGPAGQAHVPRSVARELVVASLLTMTDLHPGPLDIEVVAALDGDAVELRLSWRTSSRPVPLQPAMPRCRALEWADLAVLAADRDVRLVLGEGSVALRFALTPSAESPPDAGAGLVPRR